jgi:ribosomal protein S18 acetylase RimI-like enzyme
MVVVKDAVPADANGMSIVLTEVLLSWASKRPGSPEHVLEHYIQHPDGIRCSVAFDENNKVIGFQSLKMATAGNQFDLPIGWGIIGTYVSLDAGRRGIGRALFAASLAGAKAAGLSNIDATIGETNNLGLGYYEAMGFRTYQTKPGAVCKQLVLSEIPN